MSDISLTLAPAPQSDRLQALGRVYAFLADLGRRARLEQEARIAEIDQELASLHCDPNAWRQRLQLRRERRRLNRNLGAENHD